MRLISRLCGTLPAVVFLAVAAHAANITGTVKGPDGASHGAVVSSAGR